MNTIVASLLRLVVLAVLCIAHSAWAGESEKFLGSIWQSPSNDPLLGTFFNQITPENCGKWEAVEPRQGVRDWTNLKAMVQFAAQRNMLLKHHVLVWGHQQPGWTSKAENMADAVDALIEGFFRQFGNQITMVDVVNEPITDSPAYREQLGRGSGRWDWVMWVYRRARHHAIRYGFKGKLILNEWGVENDDGRMRDLREIVTMLQRENLLDAIGVQGHFLENAEVVAVKRRLDYLAETGLPIYISEFDLDIADDARHQQQFTALFSMFWEHPAVRGVTVWGHNEGAMWRKNGYLVRKDGSDRPAMSWLRQYMDRNRKTDAANPNGSARSVREM
jgi:endo-1,4-beta-xylanase